MARRPHPRVLLVEGKTEERVIPELIEPHLPGQTWEPPGGVPVVRIEPSDGFENMIKPGVIRTSLKEPNRVAVGVIIDADEPKDKRWVRLRARCMEFAPDMPEHPLAQGFICENTSFGSRFGVWMMPDNQSRGMLETFLRVLVPYPDENPLWQHAVEASAQAKTTHGATFGDRDHDKARIHAFLAWQKEPGPQLHLAIKRSLLDPSSPHAMPFVGWFRQLYQL